jgi:hypothetical protein
MPKILSRTHPGFFKPSRKTSLHFIGSAGLFVAVIVIAAMYFQTFRGALQSEADVPRPEIVVPNQHVRFTLYPEGIHPVKATVRAGLVSIAIEDLAGANGGLLVERVAADQRTPVGSVERLQRHWRGRSSMYLSPGIYRLRVAGGQTNEAELTVEQ